MSSRRIYAPIWTQIEYLLRNVINDLWRKRAGTLLTVLAISSSLVIPTVSYLLWKNVSQTASSIYPESQISVYLDKNLNNRESERMANKIAKFESVKSVNYISRQQSLEDFKSWSGMDNEISAINKNPLPAVVILTLKDDLESNALNNLRNKLNTTKGISDVQMDSDWIEKFSALEWLVGRITLWCSLLMLITIILVVGSNIRSDVYSKREFIEVSKLLGATESFLLRPFLYSGLILGIIGSIIAIIFSSLLMLYFSSAIKSVADIFAIKFNMSGLSIEEIMFIVAVTAFFGWCAARIAAKKHISRLD